MVPVTGLEPVRDILPRDFKSRDFFPQHTAITEAVHQTAAQITKEGMQELGVSLVRTTAHLGARNKGEGFKNHESRQGKVFYWRELDNGVKGVLQESTSSGKIPQRDESRTPDVHNIGKLDLEKYKVITDDITTDEVVITDERIQHIKSRHPNDYERFSGYLSEIVNNPDYILEANKPNTALLLKEYIENDERFQLVVRLKTSSDPTAYKNSIITFLKVEKKRYDRYLRTKKILYKSE